MIIAIILWDRYCKHWLLDDGSALISWAKDSPRMLLKIEFTSTTMKQQVCLTVPFLEPIDVFKSITPTIRVVMLVNSYMDSIQGDKLSLLTP